MSYYAKEEQETIYNYDATDDIWRVFSTYPPHVKKILNRSDEITSRVTDEDGRVIEVDGRCRTNQIRLYE